MEQLNLALAKLIEQATTGIDASVGFLQAEIPDVIQQLIMWHGVKSFVFFLLGVILFIIPICWWGLRLTGKSYNTHTICEHDFAAVLSIAIIVTSIAFLNITWLQIWIAPKVWLIEYAASLVK